MLVYHNIPLALADELTLLFQDIFSDSKIAMNYSSRRKTACIINGTVAPFFRQNLVEHVKKNPFSIAIDGSSDNDIEKMNPLTIKIFKVACGNVRTQFLDMWMSSSSTAQGIFSKMDDTFTAHDISWDNCVDPGLDNTSVNMGCRNSIKTRILKKNPATYIMGCPCHIVHNAAPKAVQAFKEVNTLMFILKTV